MTTFDGSGQGDYLTVIDSEKKNGRFMGAYYRNKPTPSGMDRWMLQWSTKEDFATLQEAKLAIEAIFPAMPKIELT